MAPSDFHLLQAHGTNDNNIFPAVIWIPFSQDENQHALQQMEGYVIQDHTGKYREP